VVGEQDVPEAGELDEHAPEIRALSLDAKIIG
jgi:hypothetical protein